MQSPFEENTTSIPSLLRNASGNSGDIENEAFDNIALFYNGTAVGGGGTMTLTVEGKDPLSGAYFPLLTSAALGVANALLTVGPAVAPVANLSAQAIIPKFYRVSWVLAGTSVTFSIGIVSK